MCVIAAEDIAEDVEDEIILEAMNQILQIIKKSKMCYKFKIELRGHEKELYCSVKIPSNFTLAEF